jgi:hypothetical protein
MRADADYRAEIFATVLRRRREARIAADYADLLSIREMFKSSWGTGHSSC